MGRSACSGLSSAAQPDEQASQTRDRHSSLAMTGRGNRRTL